MSQTFLKNDNSWSHGGHTLAHNFRFRVVVGCEMRFTTLEVVVNGHMLASMIPKNSLDDPDV